MPICIARVSHGKNSLKMLDVIKTRGLQLDMVTTTDVWATDTIQAELPPVLEAKVRIEEKLWQMYRIEVEHLCARNKDGSKKTYEQMFYHVPVRHSQTVQVERAGLRLGSILGFPDLWNPWCQSLKRNSKPQSTGDDYRIPNFNQSGDMVSATQTASGNAPPLHGAPHEAQGEKYRGIHRYRSGRVCPVRSVE